MHKKLFIAVLALGLLLLASPGFASDTPSEVPVKSFGSSQSKAALTPTAEINPDPLVTVNGGQNRTVPGSFCDGDWYAPFGFTVGGWYAGNEFYAAYQDPSNATYWNGTCVNTPSFDVTAVNTIIRYSAGPFPLTAAFQPLIFDVATGCNFDGISNQPATVAGGAVCAGPLYAFTWTGAASFLLNMPFPTECCISGDYYAAYYAATPAALRLGCTDGSMDIDPNGPASGTECLTFNDYGGGWDELTGNYFGCFNLTGVVPWGGSCNSLEHILYSEGYTPDDPATHCNPGACAYEYYYDPSADPDFAFGLPSGSGGGRTRLGIWTEAVGLDTLTEVVFAMNGPTPAVPADITIEIYAANFVGSACAGSMPGFADLPLYSEVVPAASVVWGGYTVWPLATPFVWGTLNGGPAQRIVVALGDDSPGTTNGLLANNDDGACGITDHFVGRYTGFAEWLNIFDVSGIAPEPFMELNICREVLPAVEADCGAGGPDEWTSYAHDNRQSGASSINVGDPQEVKLAWEKALPRISNFTNPTVANDIIYISSDQELNAYDLATGALIGQLAGAPEMGSSNRGNATVAYIAALGRDVVFATAGNFNAITALETNLETSPKIWSLNTSTFPLPPGPGLSAQVRFNTSKVVNVAGTDVLFVSTEPAAGAGKIWALDAATGVLYPGWPTNPVVLDAGAKHGPAVSGGKLYVGTAVGGSNVDGDLYQIDAATGTIDWTLFTALPAEQNDPSEGFPGGVSVEGDFIYALSADANNVGVRRKIDKSGAVPSVVWSANQGRGLYGTPTIGSSFVYFPLDNPNFGILQVDKEIGTVARNFGSSEICGTSVFMVPQHLTLSCDAYLFAGDRAGRWWLFDAQSGDAEWYREWPVFNGGEIVSGTALASHSGGADYAVVAIRQLGGTVGHVAAYQLNAGPRPRLIMCENETTIEVPLGSGAGLLASVPDALLNIGTAALNISAINVADPPPDGLATSLASRNVRNFRDGVRSAMVDMDGYTNYSLSTITKRQRLAGVTSEIVDGEWSATEARLMAANDALLSSRRSDFRSMAAGANMIRTSNVLVNGAAAPTSISAGSDGDLDWTFDGTGLGRGLDDEVLEIDMNDPDFNYNGSSIAEFTIHYIGGCADANKRLLFNTSDSTAAGHHLENVYNTGGLSDQHSDDLVWDDDPNDSETNLYDGGFILMGDSIPAPLPDGGGKIHAEFYSHTDLFVANPAPSTQCGIDKFTNVLLGAYRDGGCPGTPVDIHGEILITGFADTNTAATAGTPRAAVGFNHVLTEVGSYDPLYGDFKLIHVALENRDAVAKDIKFGSFVDWDVTADYGSNVGASSSALNGYFIWDNTTPGNAYGIVSVRQPSLYSSVDPTANTVLASRIIDNPLTVYPGPFTDDQNFLYGYVNSQSGFTVEVATAADKSGLLMEGYSVGPNGSAEHAVALFAVDATSNAAATIEVNAAALAKRAARWAGYARGDVNDDGLVDLADVCWLQGNNPIYPAAYSGDVNNDGLNDAADVARLLSFVSGNAGDQPAGAWRF